MFDDILVPTDGSENAERALEHATLLASAYDATVHGLYVLNVTYAADFEGGVDSESVMTALEQEGETALETVEDHCGTQEVAVTTALLEGRPAHRISSYADEHDVDLVVMGTHGRSGVSRLLLGSVTESVIRQSQRPVLTVPTDAPPIEDRYSDLLVATDGSDDAIHATETAVDIATQFDATIHGLYVVDVAFTRNQLVEESLTRSGERALADLEETVEGTGLATVTEVCPGSPHEEIGAYATNHDIDLIVLGSHGKGAFERTFLGSVSERSIRTADRPILVTRRPVESE
ncbi:hypothetical protein HSRCO_1446 [Halanaeroarchaeum sp. HSR-CO]|uniref:universal stress protein n=1 Tax=Halanaeroarchaeum sp. HSR-CO TaxID=2866382 RepID=UPI00217D21E7|nr:universal stress protein [Halanaeroarchaeum sp. HSR-CO]UWG47728.1 hypothetical protein HSRCO_1446 [Halanaeroarchaeum sp. HSR-CO]